MNFAINRSMMRATVGLVAGAMFALTAWPACAQLGGMQTATPDAGSEAIANNTLADAGIRIRGWTDEGGTAIREYATRDGLIFAYTWQGPTMPDLNRLLGQYQTSYRAQAAALAGAGASLHALRVALPDVVVDSGGQMRSYVGRAWLPAALPPGVVPADLP